MIDIVTVVFREELAVLKLQAQSINLYGHDIGRIYVVVNDDSVEISEIDASWWGQYSSQVTVVHRQAWSINYVENGWLTQQLLKLLATGLCLNEWSMVLDAKTLLVKPIVTLAQQPQVGVLDIYSVFEPSRQIVNKLFDIDITQQLGPGGVPFIFNNTLTQQMIKTVEKLTELDFATWFQQQGMVTEFILYSGYVLYKFGSFDSLYNTKENAMLPCNLCHSEVAMFDHKFKEMARANTVSVHRRAWDQLTTQQQEQYNDFLKSRGIQ
jgi:hypothetical protein